MEIAFKQSNVQRNTPDFEKHSSSEIDFVLSQIVENAWIFCLASQNLVPSRQITDYNLLT